VRFVGVQGVVGGDEFPLLLGAIEGAALSQLLFKILDTAFVKIDQSSGFNTNHQEAQE
jgi:hypothetical protein